MKTVHCIAEHGVFALRRAFVVVSLMVLLFAVFSSTASAHSLSGPGSSRLARLTNAPCLGAGCFGKDPIILRMELVQAACTKLIQQLQTQGEMFLQPFTMITRTSVTQIMHRES